MTGLVSYEEGVLLQRAMRCAICGSGLLMPHVGQGRYQLRCLKDPEHTTMTARKNTRKLVNPDGTLQEFDMTTQKPVATTELVRYQTDHGELELSVRQIQQYICPNATPQEAYLFMRLCQYQRLNPFLKEAYLVIFEGKDGRVPSMIVGRDAFIRRAEAHEQFAGFRAGIIVELESGNVEEIDGALVPDGATLLGGWALVSRKDRPDPHHTTISNKEYNNGRKQWATMPATMNRKVAIVQGLREVFPTVYAGIEGHVDVGEADEIVGQVLYDSEAAPAPPTPASSPSQTATPAPPRRAARTSGPAEVCQEHQNAPLHMHSGIKQMVHRLLDNRFCNGKGQTGAAAGAAAARGTAPAAGGPPADGFPADLPSVAQDEAELRAAVLAANYDTVEDWCQQFLRVPNLAAWKAGGKTIAQAWAFVPGGRPRKEG